MTAPYLPLPRREDVGPQQEKLPLSELAETTRSMPVIGDRRLARMRGRGWLASLVIVALAGAAGGWVASRTMESPREVAARSQPPTATVITATVRSTKIESTLVSRGTVGAVDVVRVGYGFLVPPDDGSGSGSGGSAGGGSDVLTGASAKVGARVHQGQSVVEVDGRPVIVLQGPKPMYRDMKPGMSGVDVEQLQRSLAALGDYSGAVTGVLDGATKAAVDRMYAAVGYNAPTTDGGDGTDAAQIQTDQGALSDANSTLSAARQQKAAALRELAVQVKAWQRAAEKDPNAAGPKPTYLGPAESELASDARAVTAAQQALNLDVAHRGTMVPRNEVVFVPRLPATVTQIGTGVGFAPGSPLFTLSPDALMLTAQVPTAQAGFVQVGSAAKVDLPSGQVTGTVTSVRAQSTDGQSSVEISTPHQLPVSLQGADVKVTFVAAATSGKVLAVPQGAINSSANGDLSVIVQAPDGSLSRVPVTVGVTSTDLVEVDPTTLGTLRAGSKVVIGG